MTPALISRACPYDDCRHPQLLWIKVQGHRFEWDGFACPQCKRHYEETESSQRMFGKSLESLV